jgi:hypothetical protein
MPNSPRPENPHRSVRVEDELWHAAEVAAKAEGTERAEVMRQALRGLVARQEKRDAGCFTRTQEEIDSLPRCATCGGIYPLECPPHRAESA